MVRPASRIIQALIAAVALFIAAPAVMAEAPTIAADLCSACHGAAGVSQNPDVPTLAGQPYTFIEDNLLAFRAGQRSCAPERADGSPAAALASAMCQMVRGLSEGEIAAIAAWYEGLDFVAATQPFDPALASRGELLHQQAGCDRCHADGGRETLGMAPVLAGQWTPFLRRALQQVHAGERRGPKEMNRPIRSLDDEQLEALLNYYAKTRDGAPR